MATGASRLFHSIVVMGASIGCGSGRVAPAPVDAARDAADASLGSFGDDGDAKAGDADAIGDGASPRSMCDCARPGTFRCQACASGSAPVEGRCRYSDGTGCTCDESVRIATPTDCEHPEQFVCADYPGADATTGGYGVPPNIQSWFGFVDCYCDSTRPILASQCTCPQCSLICAGPWTCDTRSSVTDAAPDGVRYACECLPPLPTIK
jgi:hypothetical protein